jgi:UDP-N-acetylglucosamine/UDP-N-acetylgalactosamine diphosphorylase
MHSDSKDKIERLVQKGVVIPNPSSVLVGAEVPIDRIAGKGVVIYNGCKVFGERTLIMPGAKLGHEGPVTVDNCQIGPNVELRGGFFQKSTFLKKANIGYGAQVRDGCILEEEARAAHTVGLKQTILFPFVTLGSLINFCDCLMAGGTGRKDHSEVGSSYIHFNFTPNQDKATPSLIGDVPRGVMLNQPPIFLGGQGGMVGPVRIAYGTVIAAGVVCRQDVFEGGRLVLDKDPIDRDPNFYPGLYWHVAKAVVNNTNYIANLIALRHWYVGVRSQFLQADAMSQMLFDGATEKLDMAIEERVKRFEGLAQKMPESAQKYKAIMKHGASKKILEQKQALYEGWPRLEGIFERNLDEPGDLSIREPFLGAISKRIGESGSDYIAAVQGLDSAWSDTGTRWLESIVDRINEQVLEVMPSFKTE